MNVKDVNNMIFYSDYLGIRIGGPSGYIANLKDAIANYVGEERIAVISREDVAAFQDKSRKKYTFQKTLARCLTFYIPSKTYRKHLRNQILRRLLKTTTFDYLDLDAVSYAGYADLLNQYNFKTITCHSTRDAIFIKNYLRSQNKQARLLLMSHTPELPSQEMYHLEKQARNPWAKSICRIWEQIEQKAFNLADILIFPTKEAMEPYLAGADYFKTLAQTKDIRFIPTGCAPIDLKGSAVDIRKDHNITTKHIISFIGRHTKIKGYDRLKEIGNIVLNQRDDVTFVIGGTQTSEFTPLNHARWIELGRINPADLLKISDLFILPNKQTYFDLILLEVLSTGVPVIASNTGGNKSVYQATRAITLYDTIEECVDQINAFIDSTDENKQKRRLLAAEAYTNNYTLSHFAKNYDHLIATIIGEE